jgi:hypothetical protein
MLLSETRAEANSAADSGARRLLKTAARRHRPPRLVKVPVCHEGTFQAILTAALRGSRRLQYAGGYWDPVVRRRGFGLYRRSECDLAWIQQRVEEYELFFYGRLLQRCCARDGVLRPRARVLRGADGAYRRADEVQRYGR